MKCKEDYSSKSSISITSGNIVYLLDKSRQPVSDRDGIPCLYQVVAVYSDFNTAGLVTSYGEYIGTHDLSIIHYVDKGPIFKREDYEVGTTVIWLDNEDVYEGVISYLHDATAKIDNIKKLYPLDYTVRIPYWKISEGRKSNKENTKILHTIIGDDLD